MHVGWIIGLSRRVFTDKQMSYQGVKTLPCSLVAVVSHCDIPHTLKINDHVYLNMQTNKQVLFCKNMVRLKKIQIHLKLHKKNKCKTAASY